MKGEAIIIIDTGTSSMRAVLFDAAGGILHKEAIDNPPRQLEGGRVEQEPESWLRGLAGLLSASARAAALRDLRVLALGLTAQRSSVIPVDAAGRPLHPAIMWQDTRTEGICARLGHEQERIYAKSGMRAYPVFSAPKMAWIKEELPGVYAASGKLLGVQDLLLHALTGRFVTDRSLASRTNLLDLESRDWDAELLGIFGLERRLLSELVDPGTAVGGLLPGPAAASGLPEGLPVVSAGGDQQCAALGLGLLGPGKVVANGGTGSYVIAGSRRPLLDPGMSITCNVAAAPDSYVLEAGSPTAGTALRWFNREFCRDCRDGENDYAGLLAEAEASPPGAGGVLCLPHLRGRGAPRWDPAARGAFAGIGLDTSRGDLARALLEGIAADLAENLAAVESMGAPVEEVAVAGGLCASPLYCRILASCFGRPVLRSQEAEATARGAWISAAVAAGLFPSFEAAYESSTRGEESERVDPEPAWSARYRVLLEERSNLYECLRRGAREGA